jgi:hypothetical protein
VRNCPRTGDDKVEFNQGQLDSAHELVSILWFCRPHQRAWDTEPSLTIEASRVVIQVRQLKA